MSLLRRLRRIIGQFRDDATGVAAVEFALVVPVMLLLYVGSVEASSMISVDRRVQTVAGSMGDLVSRSNVKIAACDIKDFFQASAGIMAPYSSTPLQQVVSSIFVKSDGTTEVKWSKSAGGATALTVGAAYPLPAAMTNISASAYVIVATASYAYTPITSIVYNQPVQLRRENFYLPRFGGSIVVDPDNTTGC
ncbi:Flp pilus assembly protein TadG [Devosia sp. UYZn731]|uniref:TadE/TadG family type IV pilus assembly protein n=1 Tax=Devosia sp. UYZn731 TaxID=3156345 RepID=UPI00339858B2